MSGGGSDDPNVFNPEIFSFRRIRLAPTFVLLGFVIGIYSILTKSKKVNERTRVAYFRNFSGSD